jgi:hypothetical protein
MAKKNDEVRIRGVASDLKNQLLAIAKNTGISLTDLLKPKLREIANSYDDSMKRIRED